MNGAQKNEIFIIIHNMQCNRAVKRQIIPMVTDNRVHFKCICKDSATTGRLEASEMPGSCEERSSADGNLHCERYLGAPTAGAITALKDTWQRVIQECSTNAAVGCVAGTPISKAQPCSPNHTKKRPCELPLALFRPGAPFVPMRRASSKHTAIITLHAWR